MAEIRVAVGAIRNRIYAGRISKDGMTFLSGKVDVTSDVWNAVIEIVEPGHEITIRADGKPRYAISVRELKEGK